MKFLLHYDKNIKKPTLKNSTSRKNTQAISKTDFLWQELFS